MACGMNKGCASAGAPDRCGLTSLMMLGALLALSASPYSRVPLLILIGVPLVTFSISAPSRLGLFAELRLLFADVEAALLQTVLHIARRPSLAARVRATQQERVLRAYTNAQGRTAAAVSADPERLHHARRMANFVTFLAVGAGLSLPLLYPSQFTFGDGLEAPAVFLMDLAVFTVVGRVVTERIALRLVDAMAAMTGFSQRESAGYLPMMGMLGASLGAVGSVVIVAAGAFACAVETSMTGEPLSIRWALWFFFSTVMPSLWLGVGAGSIMGIGVGMAQRPMDDNA